MKAICKLDYGQFEMFKTYNYSYTQKQNKLIFYVEGLYGTTEFNKKQFYTLFNQINNNNKKQI